LRGQAERIRRQCSSSIIQIGKALLESKRHLSHGAFLRWVETEVGVPRRTAQAYMRAAQWAAGKSAAVAHLPTSAIYVLSANGVPETFVIDVLERLEAGEQLGAAAIRQKLKASLRGRSGKYSASDGVGIQVQPEYPGGDATIGSPIAELATLLARKLSVLEFARVCQILTNDSVLSDPDLAGKLEQQFRMAADWTAEGAAEPRA
jgi:Protein of unknown function (DUF3102)